MTEPTLSLYSLLSPTTLLLPRMPRRARTALQAQTGIHRALIYINAWLIARNFPKFSRSFRGLPRVVLGLASPKSRQRVAYPFVFLQMADFLRFAGGNEIHRELN